MTPAIFPIPLEAGADWSASFRLRNPDGTYVDFTGCSSRLVVHSAGNQVLSVVATVTPSNLSASLTAVQTDALDGVPDLTYQWDYKDIGGKITRVLKGRVTVAPGEVAL